MWTASDATAGIPRDVRRAPRHGRDRPPTGARAPAHRPRRPHRLVALSRRHPRGALYGLARAGRPRRPGPRPLPALEGPRGARAVLHAARDGPPEPRGTRDVLHRRLAAR